MKRLAAMRRPHLAVIVRAEGPLTTVGLVPGSFDPPTIAHLALATSLHESGCGRVFLVWAVRTVMKEAPEPPLLAPGERIEALRAVCAGRPWLGTALASHGLYFQVAEAASRAFVGSEVVIGMGGDKLPQLFDSRYYEDPQAAFTKLMGAARVAYAPREGSPPALAPGLVELRLPSALKLVSSSELRRRVRDGKPWEKLVPPEVVQFVRSTLTR